MLQKLIKNGIPKTRMWRGKKQPKKPDLQKLIISQRAKHQHKQGILQKTVEKILTKSQISLSLVSNLIN